jgi:hypothetical protein
MTKPLGHAMTKRKTTPRPPLPLDVTPELADLATAVRAMITPGELAKILGVAERTVQRRCAARQWPHHRIPGRGPAGAVRFTADDMRQIMDLLAQDAVVVAVPAKTAPRRRRAV